MALEISQYKLPIHWKAGEVELKGMTLTQIAALPNGIDTLIVLQYWCAKRPNLNAVSDRLAADLNQDHLRKEYSAALERYKSRGKKIGKKNYEKSRSDYVTAQRQMEYGLFK